jgi:hypothetical protein
MTRRFSLPEYYIQSVNIDMSPIISETVIGTMGTNIQIEEPFLDNNPKGFQCEVALSLHLFSEGEAPWQTEDTNEPFGTVDVEFVTYVPDEPNVIEPHIEDWISTGEYRTATHDFRHHIESGILQYIINPIGTLVETTYTGMIPRIAFTPTEQTE